MLPAPDFNHQRPGLMPRPFRRILVGWDGSADSVAAFRMAVAIMGDAPGAVTAFAVLPDLPRPEAYRDEPTVPASFPSSWSPPGSGRMPSGRPHSALKM